MKLMTILMAGAVAMLVASGCNESEQRLAERDLDRSGDMVPLDELRGEPTTDQQDAEEPSPQETASPSPVTDRDAPESDTVSAIQPDDAGDENDEPLADALAPPMNEEPEETAAAPSPQPAAGPRSIRVITWHAPNVETPEWIHQGIRGVRRGRRMFGHYDGDYKRYTADVIQEIRRTHEPGQPVALILQHWINRANVRGNRPAGIDPHGLFTHRDDRTAAGLPGIWPEAGLEFWREANAYLLGRLKEEGVNLSFIALDTEISPHGTAGLFSFDGTFEAMVADPRWREKPLLGFDGLTAADIWEEPPLDDYRQLWMFIHFIGQQAFAAALNEVLTEPALEMFPDVLISDYRWHTRYRDPENERRPERRVALRRILDALDEDAPWKHKGVGNVASPALYGHVGAYQGATDEEGNPISVLDAMLAHAERLIELYGSPKLVAPWITTRARMDENISEEDITEEQYRQWIEALVDMGIEHFIWWPSGQGDPINEQRLTVSAFEAAVAGDQ